MMDRTFGVVHPSRYSVLNIVLFVSELWCGKNCIFSILHEEALENHLDFFRLPLSKGPMGLDEQIQKNQA